MKPVRLKYNKLIDTIGDALQSAKANAYKAINTELVKANWEIGRHIVEFEQHGSDRAVYGTELLTYLSRDLKLRHGKGFSKSNLYLCRQFYLLYPIFQTLSGKSSKVEVLTEKSPIFQTVSGKLSWSHYAELLSISNDLARSFYEKQAIIENWSYREMKRQIDAALFERLALSKNKKGVIALAAKGHIVNTHSDVIRDPFIWDFLDLPTTSVLKEKGLEKLLVERIQHFLLELGKGFSFVAKQFKISIDNDHHFVDLVFYHIKLKCYVLIELKTRKVKHLDIGQMNLYLNYFKEEENIETDNEPIGIIIAPDKNEILVKYATGGLSSKIFVSKYQLHLPDKKLLEEKVKELMTRNVR